MKLNSLLAVLVIVVTTSIASGDSRFDPVIKSMEGWKVHVDPALLNGPHAEEGAKTLRMLGDHLNRISILLDADRLKKLRTCEIWIEHHHPTLGNMQYHPGAAWLKTHGHDPRLVKKVHIPRASALIAKKQMLKHPAVVLHELAHAYHDQFLDFNHKEIRDTWNQAMGEKLYDKVLIIDGRFVKHYATTNHKEYFAESTEAYFYRNDFFPFVRAELKKHDPRMFKLMEQIWGEF